MKRLMLPLVRGVHNKSPYCVLLCYTCYIYLPAHQRTNAPTHHFIFQFRFFSSRLGNQRLNIIILLLIILYIILLIIKHPWQGKGTHIQITNGALVRWCVGALAANHPLRAWIDGNAFRWSWESNLELSGTFFAWKVPFWADNPPSVHIWGCRSVCHVFHACLQSMEIMRWF